MHASNLDCNYKDILELLFMHLQNYALYDKSSFNWLFWLFALGGRVGMVTEFGCHRGSGLKI